MILGKHHLSYAHNSLLIICHKDDNFELLHNTGLNVTGDYISLVPWDCYHKDLKSAPVVLVDKLILNSLGQAECVAHSLASIVACFNVTSRQFFIELASNFYILNSRVII